MTYIKSEKRRVILTKKNRVPMRYLPQHITEKDRIRQKQNLRKSRKLYKQQKYYTRPNIKSFVSKPSGHVQNAIKMYNVEHVRPDRTLARKTNCSVKGLQQIVKKGEGAYFSSGSRPNQTAQSWGYARLASAITGAGASIVDYDILKKTCNNNSRALKLARKTRKRSKV